MSGLIQQQPVGLLSLLGLKTLGENARNYPDFLSPVIEARDFYALAQGVQTRNAQAAGLTAAGAFVSLQIPQGEAWLVWGVGVTAFLTTVGGLLDASLILLPTNTSVAFPVRDDCVSTAAVANERSDFAGLLAHPLLCGSGTQFQSVLQRPVGGAGSVTLEVRALYTALPY